jgi:DNA-binding transcriptional ArsR family regulator
MRRAVAPDVFAAVASPIRRALLSKLRAGETPATELAHDFHLTQPAISQQLKVLRHAGLVGERRVGRQRLYHVNPGPLREVADWVRMYEHFWNAPLDRPGELIEREGAASRWRAPGTRPGTSARQRRGLPR